MGWWRLWGGGRGVALLSCWAVFRVRVEGFGGLGWKYEWAGMNDIFGLVCSCSSSTQTDTKIIHNNSVTVGWNSNLDSGFSGSSSGFRVRLWVSGILLTHNYDLDLT